MKIQPARRVAGFTVTEVLIVAGIIGVLAEIAIPNFLAAKKSAQRNSCINNLRQIDSAKQQWALEELRPSSAVPTMTDLSSYFGHGEEAPLVYCPSDLTHSFERSYNVGDLLTPPECAIEPFSHILDE